MVLDTLCESYSSSINSTPYTPLVFFFSVRPLRKWNRNRNLGNKILLCCYYDVLWYLPWLLLVYTISVPVDRYIRHEMKALCWYTGIRHIEVLRSMYMWWYVRIPGTHIFTWYSYLVPGTRYVFSSFWEVPSFFLHVSYARKWFRLLFTNWYVTYGKSTWRDSSVAQYVSSIPSSARACWISTFRFLSKQKTIKSTVGSLWRHHARPACPRRKTSPPAAFPEAFHEISGLGAKFLEQYALDAFFWTGTAFASPSSFFYFGGFAW